jgi:hypothetical protein
MAEQKAAFTSMVGARAGSSHGPNPAHRQAATAGWNRSTPGANAAMNNYMNGIAPENGNPAPAPAAPGTPRIQQAPAAVGTYGAPSRVGTYGFPAIPASSSPSRNIPSRNLKDSTGAYASPPPPPAAPSSPPPTQQPPAAPGNALLEAIRGAGTQDYAAQHARPQQQQAEQALRGYRDRQISDAALGLRPMPTVDELLPGDIGALYRGSSTFQSVPSGGQGLLHMPVRYRRDNSNVLDRLINGRPGGELLLSRARELGLM